MNDIYNKYKGELFNMIEIAPNGEYLITCSNDFIFGWNVIKKDSQLEIKFDDSKPVEFKPIKCCVSNDKQFAYIDYKDSASKFILVI